MSHLNWQQIGSEYRAETSFGTAIIKEHHEQPSAWIIGKRLTRYTTRLEDRTGAVLLSSDAPHGPEDFPDFLEAENFLLLQLAQLGTPPAVDKGTGTVAIGETEVDLAYLAYTLDICAKYLPPDTDPIHFKRLEIIKSIIYNRLS